MQSLFQILSGAIGTLLFVLLIHGKIGTYPPSLERSTHPLREFLEAMSVWFIRFGSVLYAMLAYRYDLYYPALTLGNVSISVQFILVLLIPPVSEIGIRNRSLNELGFRDPGNRLPCL